MNLHFFRFFSLSFFCLLSFSAQATPSLPATSAGTAVQGQGAVTTSPVQPAQKVDQSGVLPDPKSAAAAGKGTRSEGVSDTEAIRTYIKPSYTNLAKTLWSLNVHNLADDVAVDNFLKITECGLYSRFYKNEFEWQKIRDATRDYLKKYKGNFPRRYEYVQPLLLDRYDFAIKGFRLMPDSVFQTSDRLEMSRKMQYTRACSEVSFDDIKGYPDGMMVILKQPFAFSFVRVNDDLAQEYLKIISDKGMDITGGRPAYIRFRIKIDRYVGETYVSQDKYAILGGALETIEVFADRDLMFKLYEQSMN